MPQGLRFSLSIKFSNLKVMSYCSCLFFNFFNSCFFYNKFWIFLITFFFIFYLSFWCQSFDFGSIFFSVLTLDQNYIFLIIYSYFFLLFCICFCCACSASLFGTFPFYRVVTTFRKSFRMIFTSLLTPDLYPSPLFVLGKILFLLLAHIKYHL